MAADADTLSAVTGRRVLVLIARSVHAWQAPLDHLFKKFAGRDAQTLGEEGQRSQRRQRPPSFHLGNEPLGKWVADLGLREPQRDPSPADGGPQRSGELQLSIQLWKFRNT
jgi:hypothetical protein